MEKATENIGRIKVYFDLRSLQSASGTNGITRLFVENGRNEEPRRITVKPAVDAAYELKGSLDSTEEKDLVLSFVKANHPYRELIDHITVGPAQHHRAA